MWTLMLCLAAQSTPATMPADSWLSVNSRMRSVAPTNGQFAGTWGVDDAARSQARAARRPRRR